MNRLICFGCSITSGYALLDKNTSWPSRLSKILNKNLIRIADPGASNLEILYNVLKFDFEPTDLVVILWTYPDRDIIFQENFNCIRLPWAGSIEQEGWMLAHNSFDLAVRSWICFNHAASYLDCKDIDYYFFSANLLVTTTYKPSFIKNVINDLDIRKISKIDFALDKKHPGPKSHNVIANRIAGVINGSQ